MPKALLTATVQSHIALFHRPAIHLLKEHGYEVHVAGRDDLSGKNGIALPHVDKAFDLAFERKPTDSANISAFRQLRALIRSENYDLIHCNTPVGGVLTRLASRPARSRGAKVIYTAHGFHFYSGAPLLNWMSYYPLERALAHLTDTIITINEEDYSRSRNFGCSEAVHVPGVGIDLSLFEPNAIDRDSIRDEMRIPRDAIVVLSVGELNANKSHATIIKAISQLGIPLHYVVCGEGPLEEAMIQLAHQSGVGQRVHLLGHRGDIPRIMAAADIYCHPSRREGLPRSIMEAMASSLPVICSEIRGCSDLVKHDLGGLLAPVDDVAAFADAMQHLASSPARRVEMGQANLQAIQKYSESSVRLHLEKVYFGGVWGDGFTDNSKQ